MFGYHPPVPSSSSESTDLTSKVLQLTLLVASLIAATLLNGLVTYSLARKRQFAASAGNQFVFSLTLSSFINAIFSLPMLIAAAASDTWSLGTVTCQASAFVHLLVGVNGNLTLAMIAYDRYHAIVKPLKYHHEVSASRALCMLIAGWIFSVLITAAPLWGWSSFAYHPSLFVCSISWKRHPIYALVLFVGVVVTPMLVMCVCYGYVYLAARFQHFSVAHQLAASANESNEASGNIGAAPEDALLEQSPTKLKLKLPWVVVTYSSPDKAKRMLLILLCSYSFCWGAVLIWASCDIAGSSSNALAFICYFINSLSAIANPLMYGFMNQSIRRRITKLVCQRRVGRRGTGGRRRGKRPKAISLQPPPSPSPVSSPTNSSFASFFDYLPKQAGPSARGLEHESSRNGSILDSPRGSGGIDSYDIIRLWTRKLINPFAFQSPAQRRRVEIERRRGATASRREDHEAQSEQDVDARSRTSKLDAGDDLANVNLELSNPPRRAGVSKEQERRRRLENGSDPLFEYSVQSRKRALMDEDSDSQFLSPLSPGAPGSRLSSVTEFTDVPPYESSNCATSDSDDRSDSGEEV